LFSFCWSFLFVGFKSLTLFGDDKNGWSSFKQGKWRNLCVRKIKYNFFRSWARNNQTIEGTFCVFLIQISHFCISIECVNLLISVFLFIGFRSLTLFNNNGKSSLE
jgi:hypothetical protein